MATIDDLPKAEGIRDFYRGEIYGEIGDLLIDKGVFGDKENCLYQESLNILDMAYSLPDVILNDSISPEEKDEIMEKRTRELAERLSALRAALCE